MLILTFSALGNLISSRSKASHIVDRECVLLFILSLTLLLHTHHIYVKFLETKQKQICDIKVDNGECTVACRR